MGLIQDFLQIRFQYILAWWAKIYWNLIWKSLGFVPLGANLTHYAPSLTSLNVTRLDLTCLCWSVLCFPQTSDIPCSQVKPYSCGRVCGRTLACGNHVCEQACHTVTEAPDQTSVSLHLFTLFNFRSSQVISCLPHYRQLSIMFVYIFKLNYCIEMMTWNIHV